ncbi:hypothetical protein FRB93_006161 [Tulasnella sp. JGI-2019a]|nr:hypothetical protein FRB93_006161 [Tulasnella sp. JGI-2019a]
MHLSNIFASASATLILDLAILSFLPSSFVSAQETAAQPLPPWEFQTMYWGWTPYNATLTQCRHLTLEWWQIPGTSPTIKAPFTFTFYLEGHDPYPLNAGSGTPLTGSHLGFDWVVDLPTGGPYQISLSDANGALGGVGSYLYILGESPPVSACTPIILTPSELTLTINGDESQCSTMNVTVTGGTPPYTFTAVQQDIEPKMISYSTGNFQYVLDIGAGHNVTYGVTDSTGKGATYKQFTVGSSTDTSCLTLAPTLQPLAAGLTSVYQGLTAPATASSSSSTSGAVPGPTNASSSSGHSVSTAAVAGGVVAGVALLLLAGIAGALWQRKKNRSLRAHGLDLSDAMAPAGEPATGHNARPHPYSPTSGQPLMSEEPGFGLTATGFSQKSGMAPPAQRTTRGSSYYENFPSSSPPYSASAQGEDAQTHSGTSHSGGAYRPGFRNSADGKSDAMGMGTVVSSSRRSSLDQDLMTVSRLGSPVNQRATSPNLPPGAAAPNTFSSMPTLGMAMPPEERDVNYSLSFIPPHSPPPTYS